MLQAVPVDECLLAVCVRACWPAPLPQDAAELKAQVRSAENLKAEAEAALVAAQRAHTEEATRLRRISKKAAEDLEEAQLQLKELRERLSTLELSEQQALRELQAASTQVASLQDKGAQADSALNENTDLKEVGGGGKRGVLMRSVAVWGSGEAPFIAGGWGCSLAHPTVLSVTSSMGSSACHSTKLSHT
jgi:hypothetical protein